MATPADTGDASHLLCHRCGRSLRPGAGNWWQVRIEAVVDPTPPEITEEDLARDPRAEIEAVIGELEHAGSSEREMMDSIHRKVTLELCAVCFSQWIEDPTP